MQSARRLAELTQDWKYLARRDGWRSAASELTRAVVTLPYHHMTFAVVACSLLHPLPDLQAKIPLNIRELEPADVELVREIDCPSEAISCARRLACGQKGFLALHDGEPAGYAWGCADMTLERVRLKLASGDMLCTDAYTAPAFRGRGVHTAVTLARFRRFSDLGYCRAISYIEVDNHPSLAVWRKFGSQLIGYIEFKRFGIWRWVQHN